MKTNSREQTVRFRTEEITPEIAAKWLDKNIANRHLVQGHVDTLARDMRTGAFLMAGDPIKFDWDGNLIDGQHRLWACIEADTPFTALVGRGFDPGVKDVTDSGRVRRLGDVLEINGETQGPLLAGIVNIAMKYDFNRWTARYVPTRSEQLEWFADNPDVKDATHIANVARHSLLIAPSPIGAAYFVNARADLEMAEKFWTAASTGENLRAGDAALALRRWVTSMLARRDRPSPRVQFAYHLKAMNSYREGKSVRLLHWKMDDGLPEAWK